MTRWFRNNWEDLTRIFNALFQHQLTQPRLHQEFRAGPLHFMERELRNRSGGDIWKTVIETRFSDFDRLGRWTEIRHMIEDAADSVGIVLSRKKNDKEARDMLKRMKVSSIPQKRRDQQFDDISSEDEDHWSARSETFCPRSRSPRKFKRRQSVQLLTPTSSSLRTQRPFKLPRLAFRAQLESSRTKFKPGCGFRAGEYDESFNYSAKLPPIPDPDDVYFAYAPSFFEMKR